ncbi:DUF2280 domain-containing protein [Sinorhizobium medicae]|nr:DUF2280 domain-containing protein [Sinorhizobium medicae]
MATIAISHRAVRLRALQRMAEKGRDPGNMVLTASLMKQAAEEVGNAYTNRHELTGKDGKDLPVRVSPGYRATIWMRSRIAAPNDAPRYYHGASFILLPG